MCNKRKRRKIKRERKKIMRLIRQCERKELRELKKVNGEKLSDEEIRELNELEKELEKDYMGTSTTTSDDYFMRL